MNLRGEYAHCNESIRSRAGTPDSLEDVRAKICDQWLRVAVWNAATVSGS